MRRRGDSECPNGKTSPIVRQLAGEAIEFGLDWANGGNDDVCDLAFDYCAPVANYTVQEKGHTTRERAISTAAATESMDNSIFSVLDFQCCELQQTERRQLEDSL